MSVKLSKSAKARLKRMSASERKAVFKAATLLADETIITHGRWQAVARMINSCTKM